MRVLRGYYGVAGGRFGVLGECYGEVLPEACNNLSRAVGAGWEMGY